MISDAIVNAVGNGGADYGTRPETMFLPANVLLALYCGFPLAVLASSKRPLARIRPPATVTELARG